ncbi:MAG TPA: amino acid adenylation domain-containing protein [Thermoanaerobaculia bacterium]|nr:amino acid adenylation domain-containing protein [Thermoanaerobaculia bacterium]
MATWPKIANPTSALRAASFPELFEGAACAFPEEPAVISAGGEVWSYRWLDEASNRLARRLRALGVGPEVAVGLCMERRPELILGVVAILKAGGVYLPLNPAHPDERLLFQIEDAGAQVVLVHAGTRERLPGHPRLEVDPAACEGDGSPLGVEVPAASLCYVIYTSGSTGVPKGVGVPHGEVMLHSTVIAEDDGLGPGERVVQFSSLSFDVSLEQMLPTLISGAAVVLRGEDLADPGNLLSGFARLGITSANLPTAYWHQAVQGWPAEASPLPLRLRVQCVGGEAMLPEAARRWVALAGPLGLGGVRLINGYGPTETVVTATRYTVDSVPPGASSVPIGRTLPYRTGYVLDQDGARQPAGDLGELCLGGILARGYVNRPDLTAERFVPNPFSEEPGARMYRTGDLVRELPDGNLDYAGRIDRQVKVRGFRIEPGEIEAVLSAHPAVRGCAVVARQDTPGETQLVAYVVPGAGLTAGAVREFLRAKLPDYMVPGATMFLDALPLTPNGKVDRKALPRPDRVLVPGEGFVPPRDEVELQLARIWEELLDVRPVGVHDDFFTLGGHSLLATRVIARLRDLLQVELAFSTLFERPTVAALARAIREEQRAARLPALTPGLGGERPPLSFDQQRLWFLERLDPGTAVFNIPAPYRVRGPLRIAALTRALAGIVRRHAVLRTTIAETDSEPFQLIHPPSSPQLPLVDLSALPAERRERAADRVIARESRRPFDSERGPLVRFLLLRCEAGDHRFLAVFHHLVADGGSLTLFEKELVALYADFSAGRPPRLPTLPVQYADYAAWQRRCLTGDRLAEQMSFWRERLAAPLPALPLPTDRPRPAVPTLRGAVLYTTLPAELTAAVRELARREGSTLYVTLLAAFLGLLHRATGARDLLLGTPIAHRDHSQVESLIGMFVNTLVIRAGAAPAASFRAHLGHVRERVLEAFSHQDVPFERLVEELQPERGPHDTPFFQLMFALHNEIPSLQAGDLELHPIRPDNGTAQFELTLNVFDSGRDLVTLVEYRTELFDGPTIERMLAAFQSLLAAAVGDPDLPLSALPLQGWPAAAPQPAAEAVSREPSPAQPSIEEADAAREARLVILRGRLDEAQRELLRQRLRRRR